MVFQMARPTKRTGTQNIQFQKRIPADIKKVLDALPHHYRPRGWGKNFITISTGTPDKRKAATEFARIGAEIEERCGHGYDKGFARSPKRKPWPWRGLFTQRGQNPNDSSKPIRTAPPLDLGRAFSPPEPATSSLCGVFAFAILRGDAGLKNNAPVVSLRSQSRAGPIPSAEGEAVRPGIHGP
jgi:hypothetical protein